ncbi:G-protein alpha subunit-domain-containing protein [Amanita rubescens]|nr:G-protein alpha subunit-domain-containing protein [Amanita rubescens]
MFFPNPCINRNAGNQDDTVTQDSASITTLLSESKKALEQKKKATRLLLLGLSIRDFSPLLFIETRLIELICPDIGVRDTCVRASTGWQDRLRNILKSSTPEYRRRSELDPSIVLAASKDTVNELWQQPNVKTLMDQYSKLHMGGVGTSFLDDIDRITALNYEPTDQDIIRARIRTIGAEEHIFHLETGSQAGSFYYITDVGGSKYSRATWASFFDDVQAIIFLAPLAFNQYLEEDSTINRLEDSTKLWKEICSNKILGNAELILFFNKTDLLKKTLESGARVTDYIANYTGVNNVEEVTEFFIAKFKGYQKRLSPVERRFLCYSTSAVVEHSCSPSTPLTYITVRDTITIQHLKEIRALV